MPRTASSATAGSERSPSMSWTRLALTCDRTLSSLPLVRLSTIRTAAPRSSSASTRWDPMNEAPPVTSVRDLRHCMFLSLVDLYVTFCHHPVAEDQDVHVR